MDKSVPFRHLRASALLLSYLNRLAQRSRIPVPKLVDLGYPKTGWFGQAIALYEGAFQTRGAIDAATRIQEIRQKRKVSRREPL